MSKDSSGEWISDKEWWGYPVTKPTQAQIEELAIEAIKDELDFQRSKGSEKAIGLEWALNRLLAAADVGEFPEPTVEQIEARWERKFKGAADNIRSKERERCAEIAKGYAAQKSMIGRAMKAVGEDDHEWWCKGWKKASERIAAAILALEDKLNTSAIGTDTPLKTHTHHGARSSRRRG